MPTPCPPRVPSLLAAAAALALLWLPATRAAEPAPSPLTPEQVRLLERARDNLIADDALMEAFAYTLERRSYDVSFGKVRNGDMRLYEVGPSPFEAGRSWRRLVAVNGVPLTQAELRRNEDKARRGVADRERRLARETMPQRARRVAGETKDAEEDRRRLEDVTRVFRFESLGREVRDGRAVLAVHITPRPEARTVSDEGPLMKKWRGRGWVDEADAQVVEIQLEAFEDINIGWGMIGHVNRGSTALYRRGRLPDGTWVPVEARFRGAGRTLLLIPFQIETWAKYKDYRRAGSLAADPAAGSRR
ncbi:MAG: hypothetical protein MUF60_01535 [Vicinamibacterales bacterium]|nr:hypothetical protein [Vicinamibacterales bacterium]